MVSQSERRAQTRTALLSSARSAFGGQGYGAAKMDEIASGAGVAKGALYHHFNTKTEIFDAVVCAVSCEISLFTKSKIHSRQSLIQMLNAGVSAFFEQCAIPANYQILLRDGPSVLGWERWRAIDMENFGGIIKAGITAGMHSGALKQQPIDPLADLLFGAICEAALSCGANDSQFEEQSAAYLAALETMVRGLMAD